MVNLFFLLRTKFIWSYRGHKGLREDKMIKYVKSHQITDQYDTYSTFFENISEFPNGHFLTLKHGDNINFEKILETR